MTTAITEYSPIEAGLADLRSRYAGVAWDLRTVAGNDAARKARKELVTLRTTLEDKRKAIKAPLLAQAKRVDDEAKRITGELLEIERPIDEQIKADESRREAERQAKIEAERRRMADIRARIEAITAKVTSALRLRKSVFANAVLAELSAVEIDADEFAEFADEAKRTLAEGIKSVRAHVAGLQEAEAEAARLAAERAELERQKAEEAARRAEQERIDREAREAEERRVAAERAALERERQEQERAQREAREAEEARLRAIREAQEAEARAERERIEAAARAEREKLDAQAAEIARQREEVERREREQREREQAAEAARIADEAAKARAAEIAAAPKPAKSTRPSDDQIIEALALHFRVHESKVIEWLLDVDLQAASERMVALLTGDPPVAVEDAHADHTEATES